MAKHTGNKEVKVYHMIKVGESYIENLDFYSDFDEPEKQILKNLALTKWEGIASKFYFDNGNENQTSDQYKEQKYFEQVTKILKQEGIAFQVVVTKVTTTVEQETLPSDDDRMPGAKIDLSNLVGKSTWGTGGFTAKLHNEYVLNKEDTVKMFDIINSININVGDIESTVADFSKRLIEQLKKKNDL